MARSFARLYDNEIVEFIQEIEDINKEWHEDFVKTLVDITDLDPQPEMGWIYDNGVFSPAPPVVYSLPQQMQMASYAGCNIVWTSKPSLSALYYASGKNWRQMQDEVLYIVSFDSFSGGIDSLHLPVHDGEVIFTATDDFKKIVKAIGDWLTFWQAYVNGKTPTPPADTVTLA